MNWKSLFQPSIAACVSCSKIVGAGVLVCRACRDRIPLIRPEDIRCDRCGRPEACPDCDRRERPAIAANRSGVRYDALMKEWLALYKYRGHERMRDVLADGLFAALRMLVRDFRLDRGLRPVLTYVPLNPIRERERGFNQAEQLAKRLAGVSGLPAVTLLQRDRYTEKQSMRKRKERLSGMQGAFTVPPSAPRLQPEQPVLVVDDVYTTGSTLHECGRVLRERYGVTVYGCTWARSVGPLHSTDPNFGPMYKVRSIRYNKSE